jgi:hypothetical protein
MRNIITGVTKRGRRRKVYIMKRLISKALVVLLLVWGLCAVLPGTASGDGFTVVEFRPIDSCEIDTDGDGIVDCEEDLDGDGVWDAEDGETDFQNADTDGDGLIDSEEGDRDGDGELGPDESDPLVADTDGDGISDGDEARGGTKRNTCDTDEDGLSDGVEVGAIQPDEVAGCHGLQAAGTNYHNPYEMDPLNPDSDGDGLEDGEEDLNGNGWLDPDETDPSIVDTDRDGLEDGVEALGDFDGDGVPDFDFRLIQGEGECRPPESMSDLDCDGVPNARDDDSDNDGCPDAQEGGWLDQNANGIPDVFDNEAKICPDPAPDVGGGTGGGDDGSEGGTGIESDFPAHFADGDACQLAQQEPNLGKKSLGISILFMVFSLLVFRIRSRTSSPSS